jgi:mRNA-degrading endonuclease toxin of MazEF toxin-antitoxin module
MIRRGFIYRVASVFRDPKQSRPVLVMTGDARNHDPRSPTVVGIPITTRLKGTTFRVRLRQGTAGLAETSEAACEQVVHIPKRNFVTDSGGSVRPLGDRLDDALLDAIIQSVVQVISP